MFKLSGLMAAIAAASGLKTSRVQERGKPIDLMAFRFYFLGQHTNPRRNKQRKACKAVGHRQHKRATRKGYQLDLTKV
jgi:hypothetical protein